MLEDRYLVVCLTNGGIYNRRCEFEKALSYSDDKGIILCYPDLVWRNGLRVKDDWSACEKNICKDLKTLLTYKNWKMIVTHNVNGEYGHIHHKLTHRLVKDAVKKRKKLDKLYYFGKYYSKKSLPKASKKLKKLKKALRTEKDKMCAIYRSQRQSFESFGQMTPYENWTCAVKKKTAKKAKGSK